jgi:hypothetical protein
MRFHQSYKEKMQENNKIERQKFKSHKKKRSLPQNSKCDILIGF